MLFWTETGNNTHEAVVILLNSHPRNDPSQTKKTCYALLKRCYELISDVLLWTVIHGNNHFVQPKTTYLPKLCMDTRCSLQELSGAKNDKGWGEERIQKFRAINTTWWYIYIVTPTCAQPAFKVLFVPAKSTS